MEISKVLLVGDHSLLNRLEGTSLENKVTTIGIPNPKEFSHVLYYSHLDKMFGRFILEDLKTGKKTTYSDFTPKKSVNEIFNEVINELEHINEMSLYELKEWKLVLGKLMYDFRMYIPIKLRLKHKYNKIKKRIKIIKQESKTKSPEKNLVQFGFFIFSFFV